MTLGIAEKLEGILRLAEARDFRSVNFQLNTLADQIRGVIDDLAAEPSDDAFNDAVEHEDKIDRRLVDPMAAALRNASSAICSLQEQIDQMSGMFSDSDGAIAQAMRDGDEALGEIKAVLSA